MPLINPDQPSAKATAHAKKVQTIIESVLPEGFGRGAHARIHNLDDEEDIRNLIIAILLKYETPKINLFVNSERNERGLEPIKIDKRDIYAFRKAYQHLIDEAYVSVASYIGDVHPFAEKIVRIGYINDVLEILGEQVKEELMTMPDEMTIKKGNLFAKFMDRMNVEMGSRSMTDFLVPVERRMKAKEDDKEIELTESEVKKMIEERYQRQLPDAVSQKVSYTDYFNCAMGEKLGEVMVCWNDKMCGGKGGQQCAVQKGEVKKCPKFLNHSLLNDPAWCRRVKEDVRLSNVEIAKVLGADELDGDVRDRIAWYFNEKHGLEHRIGFVMGVNSHNGNTGHQVSDADEQSNDSAVGEKPEDTGQADTETGI